MPLLGDVDGVRRAGHRADQPASPSTSGAEAHAPLDHHRGNTKALSIASEPLRPSCRTVEGGSQAGQAQRCEQQTEVAQGDVVEAGLQQQIDDDPGQPGSDEVAPELGADRDDEPGDNLDDPDGQHRLVGVAGNEIVDLGRQVDAPVDEPVEEIVEPEHDRDDREPIRSSMNAWKAGLPSRRSVLGVTARTAVMVDIKTSSKNE
jgi:hypothetical protein